MRRQARRRLGRGGGEAHRPDERESPMSAVVVGTLVDVAQTNDEQRTSMRRSRSECVDVREPHARKLKEDFLWHIHVDTPYRWQQEIELWQAEDAIRGRLAHRTQSLQSFPFSVERFGMTSTVLTSVAHTALAKHAMEETIAKSTMKRLPNASGFGHRRGSITPKEARKHLQTRVSVTQSSRVTCYSSFGVITGARWCANECLEAHRSFGRHFGACAPLLLADEEQGGSGRRKYVFSVVSVLSSIKKHWPDGRLAGQPPPTQPNPKATSRQLKGIRGNLTLT